LVSQGRQAQWRPCRLEPAPLQEAAGWVERYLELYAARFGRLDDYLRELQGRAQERAQRNEEEQHHGDEP
jgi:hypothetical protein